VFKFISYSYLVLEDVEVESKEVDGDGVLARIVLLDPGQKGLSEEKPRQPEHRWRIVVEPILQEFETSQEVVDIATKRLQRRVRLLHPHPRYLSLYSRCIFVI